MIIFTSAMLALFLGWQVYMTYMANSTEEQEYRVVKRLGDVEIRFYPPANRAAVNVQSREGDFHDIRNRGFRELAGYIFGGNDRGEQIAMTTPVVMDVQASNTGLAGTMAFTMPRNFDMQHKPRPNSQAIAFTTTEPIYAATMSIGGFPNLEEMNNLRDRLLNELKTKGIKHGQKAEYLYYNPPTQIVGRRNEVLVRLIEFSE